MSDCKIFRAEIDGAADGGALGPRAAAHVGVCAACGDELREHAALRGLVRGLGRVEAPPDFEYRLRARMARSKPGGGHGVFGRLFPVSGLAWAAVAVCVLSVTAVVYFRQARPAGQGAQNAEQVASLPQADASPVTDGANDTADKTTPQSTVGTSAVTGGLVPASAQKVRGVKHAASQPRERELAPRDARDDSARGGTVDLVVRGANVQLPMLNSVSNGASRVQAQGIQLGTTAGTLRVALRDERGALVPMRSVSFGSQEPLSRQAAGARASAQDEDGVW